MLPRAVREQAERAEARHLELLNGNTAQATPAADQVVPQADAAVVVEPKPVDPVLAPVAVAEAVPVVPVADSWELKYKVLEGKYRAEVPRMAQRIRELEAQPATATEVVVGGDETGDARKRVTEQYGEDFATAVSDIAAEKTKALQKQVEELGAGTAERARQDFIRDLASHVPQWSVIDQDVGFTAYLDEFDAQTGRTRREFFNEADRSNNAARVASFFATYLRAKTKPVAPAAAAVIVPDVEHLISPDSSHADPLPETPKRTWTRKQAAKFYADSRSQGNSAPHGRYTAAQYQQIDADINAAIVEGRFVG